MPRNAQGFYTLPAGNPVIPGTTIESVWANGTMDDIAEALTGSLPRDGSAPMLGPLTLNGQAPANSRAAVDKAYVDNFMSFATGFPVGFIAPFGGAAAPSGWLLCDGSAVSRANYPVLFAAIGTTYGAGDNSTTFNLPDLRAEFIRGRDATRNIGSKQAAAFASHSHGVSDPGHAHPASQGVHSHTTAGHGHGITDPGHAHTTRLEVGGSGATNGLMVATAVSTENPSSRATVNPANTGIGVVAAPGLATDTAQPTVTVAGAATGIVLGAAGEAETRPQNMALDFYIKAVNDSTGTAVITGIVSSDPQMIAIINTNPSTPELSIKSNIAFGTVKLDASGRVPLSLLPAGAQQFLGYFDASGGLNPSQENPGTTYSSGDSYAVSVAGTIFVYNPVTFVGANTLVNEGTLLQYVSNSTTTPTGWYYIAGSSTVLASQVGFVPEGTISASNVQDAIAELDGETQASLALKASITYVDAGDAALNAALALKANIATTVAKDSNTGAAYLPAGTTAERPDPPVFGMTRANSSTGAMEWWDGSAWSGFGGFNGGTIDNSIQFDATAWVNGTVANHIINGDAAESYWGVLRTQGTKKQGLLFGANNTELRQSDAAGTTEYVLALSDGGNLNWTGKRFFPSVVDFPALYLGDDGAGSPLIQFNPGSYIVSVPGNGNMIFRTPGLYDFDKQIEVNKEGSVISGFYQLRAMDGLNRVWMQCQDGTGDFVIWNNGFSAPLLRLTQAGVLSILGNVVSLS